MYKNRVIIIIVLRARAGFRFIGRLGAVATKYANITNMPPI